MTEQELRLEAMRLAARDGVQDVVAEAMRIMAFLTPATAAPVRKRKPRTTDLRADVERGIEMLRGGMSRSAASKALGYNASNALTLAARQVGLELPPLDMSDGHVRRALHMTAVRDAKRAAKRAAAAAD